MPEDPLTFLLRRPAQELPRGALIYGPEAPSERLYAVVAGRVRVSYASPHGAQTVTRIVRAAGLFGESSLSGRVVRTETATAMDNVTLMSWDHEDVERQIDRDPRLGLALCQYLVRLSLDLQDRIESMVAHKTPERVMLALLRLGEDLGVTMPDGARRIDALTHHTLADYIGTSREIVTFQMNRLRREGLIRYSRQFIDIHPQQLREALGAESASAASG